MDLGLIHQLRKDAVADLISNPKIGRNKFYTDVDPYARVRFTADLQPESTQAVFSGTYQTDNTKDLQAFAAALNDNGATAGFGTATTLTPKHTSIREKRKPNDGALMLVKGILLTCERIKTPKTATNSTTVSDDSDNKQNFAYDPNGFVQKLVADLVAEDFMPYVQKPGGSQKEYLGPICWQATESGVLYALYSYPTGWYWGGAAGLGSEMYVGFERVHLTYNKEWAADTDTPWEEISAAIGPAPDASQPGAGEVLANLDINVRMIGAQAANVRG